MLHNAFCFITLFTNDGSIDDRKKRYEAKSNPVVSFLNENYTQDVNGLISCTETYTNFTKYCNTKGLRVQSYKEFISSLQFNNIETEKKVCYKYNDKFYFNLQDLTLISGLKEHSRTSHNFIIGFAKFVNVSNVSNVSALCSQFSIYKNRYESSDTLDTLDTQTLKSQIIAFFDTHKGQNKDIFIEKFGELKFLEMQKLGDIYEPQKNMLKLLEMD